MKNFRHSPLLKMLFSLFAVAILITLIAALTLFSSTLHSMKEEKHQYLQSIASNIIQNTESITNSVILTADAVSNTFYAQSYLTETETSQTIRHLQSLNRMISKLIQGSPYVNNILLVDNAGTVHSFTSFDYALASKLDQEYQIFSSDAYPDGFTDALTLPSEDSTYYVYKQTIYSNYTGSTGNKIGHCLVICSCDALEELCVNSTFSDESLFFILDSADNILASSHSALQTSQAVSAANGKDHILLHDPLITSSNWELYCSVPYSEIYAELIPIQYLSALLIVILLLTFLLLAYQLNTRIVTPILKIDNFFRNSPYDVLHKQLEIKGNNEITNLTLSINEMTVKINELTHDLLQNQARLYEVELSKKQAQLMALQIQINPHFLYNTLNSIQGLAYEQKYKEIASAIAALSSLMRYNIKGGNMTTVGEEFSCIEKYLQIINLRFSNRFTFHLHMDEEVKVLKMPRFLLQPIAENAVSHGLEPSLTPDGTLSLTASLQGSVLHFECTDNGVGFEPERLESLRQTLQKASRAPISGDNEAQGIGLLNIHKRILLIYGPPYGLTIESRPGHTRICADIPMDSNHYDS